MRALLLVCLLLLCPLRAERNEAEEAICQPFLTSRDSSPLFSLADLPRDLKRDEDGEFSCELVLQDPDLPGQIRVTIHEGLHYLALRHVQMGLNKHKRVAHHATQLAALLPAKHSFSYKAGHWLLDSYVDQPEKAVEYLHSCVYGRASNDSTASPQEIIEGRREYARALVQVGRYAEAAAEAAVQLAANPVDFNLAFQLCALRLITGDTNSSTAETQNRELYEEVSRHFLSSYEGFAATGDWAPQRLHALPSEKTFTDYYTRREPFVVSLGSGLDGALKWNTAKWSRDYLKRAVGDEEVSVEQTAGSGSLFGHGPAARRRTLSFKMFVDGLTNKTLYLNTQKPGSGEGLYRPPLHRLREDIKGHPPFLPEGVLTDDMADINLWMGGSEANTDPSTSRLHVDPTDNIYIVLKGKKTFTVFSPDMAPHMRTVGPVFAVAKNGHSFFLKPPSLAELRGLQIVPPAGAQKSGFPAHFTSAQGPVDPTNYHFSEITDPQSDPAVSGKAVSLTLLPGDILYLPCGWYHRVTSSQGEHMAVNYWFKPPGWQRSAEFERAAALEVYKKIYSIQDGEL